MAKANEGRSKIPEISLTRAQQDPELLFNFGYNISACIVETLLVYLQGIFMTTKDLDFNFDYTDNSPIKIVDQGAYSKLELGTDPVIVVERGTIQAMGRGGLNNMVSLDVKTGTIEKADLFHCPVSIRVYGDYTHVEQYASLIFLSLTFLTEPLRKFTIYRVQQPSMGNIQAVKRDSKVPLFMCPVNVSLLKEGSTIIESKDHAVLRKLAFKGRQVFDSRGDRIIIRIS